MLFKKCCPFYGGGSAIIYSLLVVDAVFWVFSVRSLFCFAVHCILSSFVIISLGNRGLVTLFLLCSECHVPVIVL